MTFCVMIEVIREHMSKSIKKNDILRQDWNNKGRYNSFNEKSGIRVSTEIVEMNYICQYMKIFVKISKKWDNL